MLLILLLDRLFLKYYGSLEILYQNTMVFWKILSILWGCFDFFLFLLKKRMKRLFEPYLDQWRTSPNRKPLIIRGARQVGKTWLVDQLGKNAFDYYLKVNPEKTPNLHSIFKLVDPQLIINELSVLFDTPVIEGKTLLFIDEVQLLPEALVALRYFYEEKPGLHVIAAGSLLDHTLNEMNYSMPVGRVEFAYLYPMNFLEFLLAIGKTGLADYIQSYKLNDQFGEALHTQILNWLRLYFFIGGMPASVKTYVETGNLIEVEKVQNAIITSFKYDFAKYGTKKQQSLLSDCLEYAARNIGKKLRYVNINRAEHSNNLKEALRKLELSRLLHMVRHTSSSKVPITQYVDEGVFKPLFLDIGLVCNLAGIKLTDIREMITDFEGMLAEQFVGQQLITGFDMYEDARLYYWMREKKNANAEIDFLHQIKNRIYPIEVKAGKSGTLKSLQVYLGEKGQKTGIRFNLDLPSFGRNLNANINIQGQIKELTYDLISLPVYMAGFVNTLLNDYRE